MIEPAAYGMPVCFGPHTSNFRDVVALMLQEEAAFVVRNELELKDFVSGCLAEPEWREHTGDRARELVISQQGARQRTLERLQSELQLPARRAA